MSPVVAVCPEHGPFSSNKFKMMNVKNASIKGQREICPQCGRVAQVMEGLFDFDAEGIATVIAAPEWSREALYLVQRALSVAGKALEDPGYSDRRAFGLLDKKLDGLSAQLADQGAGTRERMDQLTDQIHDLQHSLSRSRLARVLIGVAFAISLIADGGAVAEMGEDAVEWIAQQINDGPPRDRGEWMRR